MYDVQRMPNIMHQVQQAQGGQAACCEGTMRFAETCALHHATNRGMHRSMAEEIFNLNLGSGPENLPIRYLGLDSFWTYKESGPCSLERLRSARRKRCRASAGRLSAIATSISSTVSVHLVPSGPALHSASAAASSSSNCVRGSSLQKGQ